MHKITIAIDGHSSCGKSTLAKQLAERLGYTYIDSGAMYRAVTLYFLRHEIGLDDEERIAKALASITIHFDGEGRTILNGEKVEREIRKMYVSDYVSPVSALTAVRRAMVRQQQQLGAGKGIVMDGRDIGTVVFPDAALKIFLTASLEERTRRRYKELRDKGISVSMEAVKENLQARDHIDSRREDSPLRQADDAVVIDNTHLSQEEQLQRTLQLAIRAGASVP